MELWKERTSGLTLRLDLSTEFVTKITDLNSNCIKKLLILPDEIVNKTPEIQFILHEADSKIASFNDSHSGIQELVISKSNFKQIFLESYHYIYKSKILKTDLNCLMTTSFGVLLVTPIDTTALRINYDCLIQLNELKYFFETYFLLACYLTCNYDKTNKSSTLWEYFKKIHLKLISQINEDNLERELKDLKSMSINKWLQFGSANLLLLFAIRTCLYSIQMHPRNYYASNSLRFFVANSSNKQQLFKTIIEFIGSEFDDLSLWLVLIDLIKDIKTHQLDWYRTEWERYGGDSVPNRSYVDITGVYESIKSCMMEIRSYGSILTTIELQNFLQIEDSLIDILQDKINTFERKYNVKIDCKLGVLIDNKTEQYLTFQNDSILQDEFKFTLNIKKVIFNLSVGKDGLFN